MALVEFKPRDLRSDRGYRVASLVSKWEGLGTPPCFWVESLEVVDFALRCYGGRLKRLQAVGFTPVGEASIRAGKRVSLFVGARPSQNGTSDGLAAARGIPRELYYLRGTGMSIPKREIFWRDMEIVGCGDRICATSGRGRRGGRWWRRLGRSRCCSGCWVHGVRMHRRATVPQRAGVVLL